VKIIAAGSIFVEHIIAQKTGDRVTENYGTASETNKPANQVSPSFKGGFELWNLSPSRANLSGLVFHFLIQHRSFLSEIPSRKSYHEAVAKECKRAIGAMPVGP
jgi:hypothetical protein